MATATPPTSPLPYGVGQMGPRFLIATVALIALVVLGIVAHAYQWSEGFIVTGMRDLGPMGGAPWGLYITFYVYFVGVSFAGITVAAIIRLFNLDHLRPIARMAELLTIVALLLGSLSILADLGQPGRGLVNLFRYARPQSAFFGTFTLVLGGYLFASVVYFYLDGRRDASLMAKRQTKLAGFYRLWAAGYSDTQSERDRHQRTTFWLALAILPLLVVAHSTLGFIFGIQGAAAGWYSALQAPAFVVLAGVSGIGHIVVMAAIARRTMGLQKQIPDRIFAWLGNLLWILIAAYLYFIIAEMLTAGYAAHAPEQRVVDALLTGTYAPLFWGTIALFVVSLVALFWQFAMGQYNLAVIVSAGVLVNIAAITKRYLVVVPSQTHGRLLPYETGSYSPTWVEYAGIIGLMALGALMIIGFFKIFPLLPLSANGDEIEAGTEAVEANESEVASA